MKPTYQFHLTPTNEGQPLNYSEVFESSARSLNAANQAAKRRAVEIVEGLTSLLPAGSFDCEVEPVIS